jgi:hypothetical protein
MQQSYEITIEKTADEAENLLRFDAEWLRLRQEHFGSVIAQQHDSKDKEPCCENPYLS